MGIHSLLLNVTNPIKWCSFMDRITQSLQAYLKSAKIKYQTLFNSDTGNKNGYPTSTSFHIKNSADTSQVADIVIDIFPKVCQIFLSAHPRIVIDGKGIGEIKALETKWNACGLFTRIRVSEEMGVVEDNRYCFSLILQGISDPNGPSKYVWKRYIEILKSDTFEAWNKIAALSIPKDAVSI